MYSFYCSRCLAVALVPLALVSILANLLLLFPDLQYHYLAKGRVTREAMWATGIWMPGFVVLVAARGFASSNMKEGCCLYRADMLCRIAYSCVVVGGATLCFMVNATGLTEGPLCLHNGTEGLKWDRPLKRVHKNAVSYLYEPTRWAAACEEPRGVVMWNIVLFSVILVASGLQGLLGAVQILNALLGVLAGPRFRKMKIHSNIICKSTQRKPEA